MAIVRDPICGMMIDSTRAAGSSVFQGTTFYFCSPGCRATFEKNPAKHARTT